MGCASVPRPARRARMLLTYVRTSQDRGLKRRQTDARSRRGCEKQARKRTGVRERLRQSAICAVRADSWRSVAAGPQAGKARCSCLISCRNSIKTLFELFESRRVCCSLSNALVGTRLLVVCTHVQLYCRALASFWFIHAAIEAALRKHAHLPGEAVFA